MKLANRLGDQLASAVALATLGWVAADRADHGRAATYFADALRLSGQSGAGAVVALAIEGLAAVAVGQGRAARAARCLGAVTAVREATGIAAPLFERVRRESVTGAARARTGEEAFTAAWAEGRAMNLVQAVAYALDQGE